MDVANRNVLTNERFQLIGNAVILRAAVSSDGEWLATLESWSNAQANYRDTRLKFWRFNIIQSYYELNTDALMPHEGGGVVSLAFHTGSVGLDWPCLVSVGRTDGMLKLWQLVGESGNASLRRTFWTCQIAGDFRKMMPRLHSRFRKTVHSSPLRLNAPSLYGTPMTIFGVSAIWCAVAVVRSLLLWMWLHNHSGGWSTNWLGQSTFSSLTPIPFTWRSFLDVKSVAVSCRRSFK